MGKITKVRLIEPRSAGCHVYSRIALPRLGLPILGAILKQQGLDVRIYCQDFAEVDYQDICSSDLVGISTTTSTAPEAYRMADRIREAGVPVVFGGSHASFMAEESLEHGDYCISGEAEAAFPELITAIESGSGFDSVGGLSYRSGGEILKNPQHQKIHDLDSLPFPDLSLIAGHEKIKMTPMLTSRGCPFDCSFCSVTKMFGHAGRFRSVENVIEELKWRRPEKVFFYDDNFAINRNHTKELLEAILSAGLEFSWTAQVRTDVVRDRELLRLMKKTNCYINYIGFESVNPEALREYNKRQNVEQMVETVRLLHEHGILIHGMFVIGAGSDTPATIRETVQFALRHKIDTAQFMVLTPLPGTPYYEKMEENGRLLTKDWTFYDGAHVVYQPKLMSPYELQKESVLAMRRFYRLTECVKMIASADFVVFLAKFNVNLLLGRWKSARKQLGARVLRWFYRAYGHFLLKRWETANRGFSERVTELANQARKLTSARKPDMEGSD